ncbi:MAG: hypothetical protein ACI8XW_003216 [Gammaproteobacteria bacterium]|jgi:hypothetical protein
MKLKGSAQFSIFILLGLIFSMSSGYETAVDSARVETGIENAHPDASGDPGEVLEDGNRSAANNTLIPADGKLGQTTEAAVKTVPPGDSGLSLEWEFDPYYSNISLFLPLSDQPMPEIELANETGIYLELLRNAFSPRFFLTEISVNPLPLLGVYLKDRLPGFFADADVNEDLNLIQVFTEGFEEPYALSFFVGNIIRFKSRKGGASNEINKGFSGFLVSFGDQHIKDSVLIDDDWYEFEWKLKGDRQLGMVNHSWSFRVGGKQHGNPDIADVIYVGIRRELFDRTPGSYRWLDNTGIDFAVDFARQDNAVVQQRIFFEKEWPRTAGTFNLGIGLNRNINRYSGALAGNSDETRLIIQPGFSF